MIVGVSFNVFNGEEHLIAAIRSIRQQVDHISLVVQFISNMGNPCSENLRMTLQLVSDLRLADEVFIFIPDFSATPVENELSKRKIGLNLAKKAAVTHFMTMDCDEYYDENEMKSAKQLIKEFNIKATAVRTYLHIKRPIYRSRFPEPTCCAFLTEIDANSELCLGINYPYMVDPTRRVINKFPVFMMPTSIITMKHMNLVRKDLRNKLDNSTNAAATEFMDAVFKAVEHWRLGENLILPNKPSLEIVEVDDIFQIDALF